MYKETLGLVCIMNLGGIVMGLTCDCNGIESWWDCNEKQLWWDYQGIYEDENTFVI